MTKYFIYLRRSISMHMKYSVLGHFIRPGLQAGSQPNYLLAVGCNVIYQ